MVFHFSSFDGSQNQYTEKNILGIRTRLIGGFWPLTHQCVPEKIFKVL